MTATASDFGPTIDALCQRLGGDAVLHDAASRRFHANDIFWQPGIEPLAVVRPGSAEELADAVRIVTSAGLAVVPRGGAMSYTKGYIPARAESVVVDTTRLDRVLEVNAADLYITVEAGCPWSRVAAALEGTGLRTPYWGPLSGMVATVGGALSQNSAFFGSTVHGTVADSVLGLAVVLADGRVVTTGSGGRANTKPFTREGGPDLTGLFLGDNGAFGIKVAATLRLVRAPTHVAHISFGFRTLRDMAAAQVAMVPLRAVAEGFGIDRTKVEHSASVNKLMSNLKTLGNVIAGGASLASGVMDAARIAAAGTAFLKEHAYTLHLVVEAPSASELDRQMGEVRAAGTRAGVELPNTVPKAMRAAPFGPPRGMLGKDGERWVPIHAVFPLSAALDVVAANDAFFEGQRAFMAEHGILYSVMTMTVGSEFFLEPAFYWHDEITPLHARTLGEDVVRPWRERGANPRTREAVATLRRRCQEFYASHGGVSWQVARDYPFREVLSPGTWSLLTAVKAALDPAGLMNPGSLGLAN